MFFLGWHQMFLTLTTAVYICWRKLGYPVGVQYLQLFLQVLAVFLLSPNKKNPKICQYLHGHGIHVLQLYIANPCIYWVCSHHEPNVGKFAVPFTLITWDPMGKRFWVIHRYVSTQFVGVHQFWYFSHVNSSQISSTFEEFEGTRLWNMINIQPDRRAQDFSRWLLGGECLWFNRFQTDDSG